MGCVFLFWTTRSVLIVTDELQTAAVMQKYNLRNLSLSEHHKGLVLTESDLFLG